MLTAEEFVRELGKQCRVDNPWGFGEHDERGPIAMVEARDAAMRLAVLDELERLAPKLNCLTVLDNRRPCQACGQDSYREAIVEMRASKPGGGT